MLVKMEGMLVSPAAVANPPRRKISAYDEGKHAPSLVSLALMHISGVLVTFAPFSCLF